MQTAKSFLTLLALGLCVVAYSQPRPDTEAQAKAREALRKKIAELEGQPIPAAPGTTATPATPPSPAAPPAPTATAAAPPVSSTAAATPTPEQVELLRQATRLKIIELNSQPTSPPVAVTPPPASPEPPSGKAPAAPAPTGFEPIPPPPSPIPPSKEMQLAELLKKYKADEITPEQYHTERAKILAQQ